MNYLKSGTLLEHGKYRIIEAIGRGGFGITYLAEHTRVRRQVCIKEFFPECYCSRIQDGSETCLTSDRFALPMDRFKAKFIKEAQIIAEVKHDGIVPVYDVFEENNTAYYVMEYIDGETLSSLVQRSGAIKEQEAIEYIRQVADALEYIHSRKIMHLDIKPSNIILRHSDNRVVLIDFGLSKHYDVHSGEATSTTPVGYSHGFAPMEQYKQGGVGEFSPETDIYSLGATLYYLVVGAIPPDALAIADDGLPKLPRYLSTNLCKVIERSMAEKRKQRPHSIKEFLALFNEGTTVAEVIAPSLQNAVVTSDSNENQQSDDESNKKVILVVLVIIVLIVVVVLVIKYWEYILGIFFLLLFLPSLLKR